MSCPMTLLNKTYIAVKATGDLCAPKYKKSVLPLSAMTENVKRRHPEAGKKTKQNKCEQLIQESTSH